MGAATYWASQRNHPNAVWLWLIVPLTLIALLIDFRARIAVALSVALMLWFARRSPTIERWSAKPLPHYLGRTSYSLFLVHFPMLLLANGLFTHFGLSGPFAGAMGMLATWGLSLWVADRFHVWIEAPAANLKAHALLRRWKPASPRRSLLEQLSHAFAAGLLIMAGSASLWGIIGTQASTPWSYRRNPPASAMLVQYSG
jgi:peptidoglycan/LPS O-acetylase OafA/YrhL